MESLPLLPLADGSNINPVAFALLNLKLENGQFVIPSPQRQTAGVNYAVSIPARYEEEQYIANGDHQLTSKNRLMFKSVISSQPAFQPLPAATVPGFGTTQDLKSRILSLTDTNVFSANLVNEARMGFSRLLGVVKQENQIPLSAIGMQRFNSGTFPDLPQVIVTGVFNMGYSVNADQGVTQYTYHFFDTLSWTRGKHSLRAGGEIRRYVDGDLYASRTQAVEKRYTDLCQLLNIRAYPHLSKARSVLAPSLDELVAIGYLSDWELVKTVGGEDFNLFSHLASASCRWSISRASRVRMRGPLWRPVYRVGCRN